MDPNILSVSSSSPLDDMHNNRSRRRHMARTAVYQPLSSSRQCIRLLELSPSGSIIKPIECTLRIVELGQSPKYEALSYTWGNGRREEIMKANGQILDIRRNLWNALRYLRRRGAVRVLWVDAVCINQNDLRERTSQVRLMPHLYSRAQQVIVWLGEVPTVPRYLMPWLGLNTEFGASLCRNDYWQRVWIVQEIGKARSITVCFGSVEMPWEDFIAAFRGRKNHLEPGHHCGPLILDNLIRQRYKDGLTLINLIRTYAKSKCEDSRDKIYGFVGLAIDADGFPMDYEKAMEDVWKDAMTFVLSRQLLGEEDPWAFGLFLKDLLGCNRLSTRENSTKPRLAPYHSFGEFTTPLPRLLSLAESDAFKFFLSATVIGRITYLGPSTTEFRAIPSTCDKWTNDVRKNFSADNFGVNKEIGELEWMVVNERNQVASPVCSFKTRTRWYSLRYPEPVTWYPPLSSGSTQSSGEVDLREHLSSFPSKVADEDGCCLFQFKHWKYPAEVYGRIGVCSREAQAGDLICWTQMLDKYVVVRYHITPSGRIEFEMVGTAYLVFQFSKLGDQFWKVATALPVAPDQPYMPLQLHANLDVAYDLAI